MEPRTGAARESELASAPVHEAEAVLSKEADERVEVLPGMLVRDAAGRPVAGAEAVWVVLPEPFEASGAAAVLAAARRETTASDGRLELRPSGARDGAWICKAGHAVAGVWLGASELPTPTEVLLPEAEPFLVRVVDGQGQPVEGAEVLEAGLTLPEGVRGPEEFAWSHEQRGTTDAAGWARFPAFRGARRVTASAKGIGSASLEVDGRAQEIELRLGASFFVAGHLSIDAEMLPDAAPKLRIRTSIGSNWKDLKSFELAGGEFGPFEVLRGGASTLQMRLEGAGMVPEERFFETPAAGATVRFELVAERGTEQWYNTVDAAGKALPGVSVAVFWRKDGNWVRTQGKTDETGYLMLGGLRPGATLAEATHPGYAPFRLREVVVPSDPPVTYTFVMRAAAGVRGRCTFQGKPVEDFTVVFWVAAGGERLATERSFEGRQDGGFELLDAPLGDVFLVASSPESPGSEPVAVRVTPAGVDGVELVLEPALLGTGKAVDASTGEPLATATVQSLVRGTQQAVAEWGPPVAAGSDGALRVAGLRAGENYIRVGAPGFANQPVRVMAVPGSAADFGTVALQRGRDITLRLVGGAVEDVRRHWIRGEGAELLSVRRFEPDSAGRPTVVFPAASPGFYNLFWDRPDGSTEILQADFVPGQPWEIELLAAGGGVLDVEVRAAPPGTRGAMRAFLNFADALGIDHVRHSALGEDDRHVFPEVLPGTLDLQVTDMAQRTLARQKVTVTAGATQRVLLDLGGIPASVLVVNAADEPLSGVFVRLRADADLVNPSWFLATTGADGRAELGRLSPGAYVAHLTHSVHGMRLGAPVHVADEQAAEIRLELDATGHQELLLQDGGEPVPSAVFHLLDASGGELFEPFRADDSGVARVGPIAAGPCFLRTLDERLWPETFPLTLAPGGEPLRVPVRLRGNLRVQVHNAQGIPVAGLALVLKSAEDGAAVSTWCEPGLISASNAELRTDNHGELELRGLPRGAYSWEIPTSGGSPLSGVVVVPAEDEFVLALTVP